MTLRKKSLLIFMIFLIVSNYLLFLLYWTLNNFSRYEYRVSRSAEEILLMEDIGKGLENRLGELALFFLSPDRTLSAGHDGGDTEALWDRLTALTGDSPSGQILRNLRENCRAVIRQLDEIETQVRGGDREGAREKFLYTLGGENNLAAWVMGELDSLTRREKELAGALNRGQLRYFRLLRILSLPVFLFVHLFTLLLLVFSRKRVIGPLESLERSARSYERGKGVFSLPPAMGNDEIGSLGQSLKKMVAIIENQHLWLERNLENIPDGIFSLDGSSRITYMNRKAEEMTGWSFREGKGLPFREVISLKDEISPEEHEESVRKTTLYPQGNSPLDVEVRWFGIKDELGTVLTIRDIGPDMKRHRELENLKKTMIRRDKLSSIGLLAAGMAHEINNPIGYIQSNMRFIDKTLLQLRKMAELVVSDMKVSRLSDSIITKFFTEMDELIQINGDNRLGIEKIEEIVSGINSYSRDKSDAAQEDQDINVLVERTVKMVRNKGEKKTRFHMELNPLPPTVCFPHQIEQVMVNLLINAIHAADGNRPEISVSTSCTETMIRCSVEDNGTGIDEKNLDRIFDPFFTTKKQGEGTGLGLYVSYNIIRKHGGDIRVGKSRWGGGELAFYIPVRQKNVI